MENFIRAKLKIIIWEEHLRKLWELFPIFLYVLCLLAFRFICFITRPIYKKASCFPFEYKITELTKIVNVYNVLFYLELPISDYKVILKSL